MDISKAITALRGNRKQREFAELVGTNENTVSRWERNATIPDEDKRLRLVELALREHRRDLAVQIAGQAARLLVEASQSTYPRENVRVHNVFSWVDSQNSFGAQIRTKFFVKLKLSDGKWLLLDLKTS